MNLEFPKDEEKNWGDAGIMLNKRSTKIMNIFIIGCGKVGASLVGKLSEEGNDITVIDPDPEKIEAITNSYDVIGVVGSGQISIRSRRLALKMRTSLSQSPARMSSTCCAASWQSGRPIVQPLPVYARRNTVRTAHILRINWALP